MLYTELWSVRNQLGFNSRELNNLHIIDRFLLTSLQAQFVIGIPIDSFAGPVL